MKEYEVFPCEPLHDISKWTEKLLSELPYLIGPDPRNKLEDILEATIRKKDKVRGCDLTEALFIVTLSLKGEFC